MNPVSLLIFIVSMVVFHSPALAVSPCSAAPRYFRPLLDGDGQRYPLTIGPLVWHVIGSGLYPVEASDGLTHVAFAMQFTNSSPVPATVASVGVLDPSRNNEPTGNNHVLSIRNDNVTGQLKLFSLPPTADKSSYLSELAAGKSGVMFFDLSYANRDSVPCTIALRVHALHPESKHAKDSTVTGPILKISSQPAIVLAPPFKGNGWVNANGCCAEIGPHRFVTNPTNGTLQPSEQFAIDWIKIDQHGKAFRGDGKTSEQWLCYGVELLAVAAGTVVEVMRDLPDQPPGRAPTDLSLDEIPGNHVILDLGAGRYAVYAHMAPGSVTVHVGDHVHSGQRLGLLGNSGNTTGPHLHFQISDTPSTLDTTSLPFVFDSMLLEGRTSLNLDDIETYSIKGTALPMASSESKRLTRAMPLSRDVITFE